MKVNNTCFAEWLEKYRRIKAEAVQILTDLYREAVPKAMRVRRNNNGKQDLLIGEEGERGNCYLNLYINEGTKTVPDLRESKKIQVNGQELKSTGYNIMPFVIDFNGDQKKDLIIKDDETIKVYINNGSDSSPTFDSPITIDVNSNGRNVCFIDMDEDGIIDLIAGDNDR